MERTGYGANALPGVVVGLSLVFLAARYLPAVYLTFPLLIAAYLIRFFAQALSGVDTALAAAHGGGGTQLGAKPAAGAA